MRISFMKHPNFVVIPLVTAMISVSAHAEQVVTDIEFSGLQRWSQTSLYPLLPISAGSTLTEEGLAQSIKALYDTGNFANIQSTVNNGKVLFEVVERPIIAEVNFDGNSLIPTQGLNAGLKTAGLAPGNVLKQSTLVGVANELQQQYILQGYHNSNIKVDQTLLDGNRVKLDITFDEGKAAKVVDINVSGNNHFSDGDIKRAFLLKETTWYRFFSNSDRYAKDKFAASIEKIKAMYMDEGFVRVKINVADAKLSDDKQSVNINVDITEGEQYNFNNVGFKGDTTYDEAVLADLVTFKKGELFSKSELEKTTNAIANRFGNDGFYFAEVRPVTRINDANKTIDVEYFINPSEPVYVRRINFVGNTKTEDEVLRREMRQLEGALSSNEKIHLSRARLMRTGFFKDVKVDVVPVPNQPDQVDVNYTVEEQSTGSSTLAVGYSQSGGLTFQADLSQRNFMGTGNRVNVGFTRTESRDNYNLGLTNPYFTKDGVSQSINGYYRKTKYDDKNVSNYVMDSYGGTLRYGYPVNENIRLSAGLNIDNTKVNGGKWMGVSNVQEMLDDGATISDSGSNFKNDYTTYNLLLGWNYNSLDKPVFPTKGVSHDVDLTLGFGDKTYQKAVYKGNVYYPLYKDDFILRGYTKLGYGNDLPFYENFYAGGYGSVRGYDVSSLGPQSPTFYGVIDKDTPAYVDEVGGNAMATFGTELILPLPFKGDWTDKVRPVLFVEGGQVFDTTDKEDRNFKYKGVDTGYPLIEQDNEFRYSAGIGSTWYTPIGPISLSYAVPFNDKEGDKTEKVQFQIGSVF